MQVAQRGVHAPFAQRVYVELRQTGDLLVTDVLGPQRGIPQIEPLFGGESVDRGGFLLAFERVAIGRAGYTQTIEENTRKVTLDGITARLRNQCR